MPLVIVGEGAQTKPIHVDPALPASVIVPSKREVLEALAVIQSLAGGCPKSFDVLRRFILSR